MTDNASWSSKKWDEKVKKNAALKAAMDYDNAHVACPRCGSIRIRSYTAVTTPKDPLYDTNNAWCYVCKWSGIVHDLVAASKPAQK